ncbi:unnamed protein product [Moneuplotes crassus]|uniref:Uncharacterized protein n=1 Tax=Euplotes crassus TaxID=5936 RepID=A0AAD1XIX9_EUPCR|nr:unnamed protein product [Moneuplotes crassus]
MKSYYEKNIEDYSVSLLHNMCFPKPLSQHQTAPILFKFYRSRAVFTCNKSQAKDRKRMNFLMPTRSVRSIMIRIPFQKSHLNWILSNSTEGRLN